MLYGRFTFRCQLEDEAILPAFKGSTFRGAFGSALKRVVCALRTQECETCLLGSRCVYAFFFETKELPAGSRKTGTIPHPFVIEPPLNNNAHFKTDDEFDFDLLLFGSAVEYIPYCIFAFDQMGQTGIGKRISGRRAAFRLKEVFSSSSSKTIYSSDDKRLVNETPAAEITLPAPVSTLVSGITVHLETPFRVKQNNRLTVDLPFETLIRAALRRISSLFACYGSGEPDIDYKGMVERARNVETAASKLYWFDWERYSNRQETRMMLGGLLGSVTYSGGLTEFMPLLQLCAEVHLGKQTTFGLGKIKISAEC